MKPINLGKTRTLKDIEAAICKICDSPGERFLIPADMLSARHGAMHDAARLQLIVTLARQQLQSDYLDFNPQADAQALLRNLANCSPGIAALRLPRVFGSASRYSIAERSFRSRSNECKPWTPANTRTSSTAESSI
ncbi:hypothetical protein NWF32_24670 [Pseudomonas qingdaonensis]|nr:hypothetical protein [Pseudomonas qingdaonensis]